MVNLGFIKKVPFFSEFSETSLKKLCGIGKLKKYESGRRIFDQGTPGDRLYIVFSGRVKIFAESGPRIKTLAHLERGEFFGEMSLLDEQPHSASSMAMEHTELLVLTKKDFSSLIAKNPEISLQIMKTLSKRLRQADKEIEALTFGDVLGRIASTLLQLAAKYGEITEDGCEIKMPLNHRDIAEIAGTGREMVSRTLSRFRRLKLINYNESSLRVIDAQKLKLFSGGR